MAHSYSLCTAHTLLFGGQLSSTNSTELGKQSQSAPGQTKNISSARLSNQQCTTSLECRSFDWWQWAQSGCRCSREKKWLGVIWVGPPRVSLLRMPSLTVASISGGHWALEVRICGELSLCTQPLPRSSSLDVEFRSEQSGSPRSRVQFPSLPGFTGKGARNQWLCEIVISRLMWCGPDQCIRFCRYCALHKYFVEINNNIWSTPHQPTTCCYIR